MAESPDASLPRETQTALSAWRAQREDAKLVLAWFQGPAWERIKEQYQMILDRYERLLHHPEISSALRDRACMGVMVAREFLSIQERAATQLKTAEARIASLEQGSQPAETLWDRILTFVR